MITLTEMQMDALTEVFNVGAGRAASSLSAIVGEVVGLTVPTVDVKLVSEIQAGQLIPSSGKIAVVDQHFSGPIDAKAVLVFPEEQALLIVRDMLGSQISIEDLVEFEQEAMCELGNIILNACLSSMADMLSVSFRSSLPNFLVASSEIVLQNFLDGSAQAYVLMLRINIVIEKRHTEGHLIFLLSSDSLSKLLRQIQNYLETIP